MVEKPAKEEARSSISGLGLTKGRTEHEDHSLVVSFAKESVRPLTLREIRNQYLCFLETKSRVPRKE